MPTRSPTFSLMSFFPPLLWESSVTNFCTFCCVIYICTVWRRLYVLSVTYLCCSTYIVWNWKLYDKWQINAQFFIFPKYFVFPNTNGCSHSVFSLPSLSLCLPLPPHTQRCNETLVMVSTFYHMIIRNVWFCITEMSAIELMIFESFFFFFYWYFVNHFMTELTETLLTTLDRQHNKR